MSTHYSVLGVAQDCTFEDLKKAFRECALECHPDKVSNALPNHLTEAERDQAMSAARSTFEEVHEAYAVLADSRTREEYDRSLPRKTTIDRSVHHASGGTLLAESVAVQMAASRCAVKRSRDSDGTAHSPPLRPFSDPISLLRSRLANVTSGGASPPALAPQPMDLSAHRAARAAAAAAAAAAGLRTPSDATSPVVLSSSSFTTSCNSRAVSPPGGVRPGPIPMPPPAPFSLPHAHPGVPAAVRRPSSSTARGSQAPQPGGQPAHPSAPQAAPPQPRVPNGSPHFPAHTPLGASPNPRHLAATPPPGAASSSSPYGAAPTHYTVYAGSHVVVGGIGPPAVSVAYRAPPNLPSQTAAAAVEVSSPRRPTAQPAVPHWDAAAATAAATTITSITSTTSSASANGGRHPAAPTGRPASPLAVPSPTPLGGCGAPPGAVGPLGSIGSLSPPRPKDGRDLLLAALGASSPAALPQRVALSYSLPPSRMHSPVVVPATSAAAPPSLLQLPAATHGTSAPAPARGLRVAFSATAQRVVASGKRFA